ncbi:GvpL/GvpF family gas vesicle protein [Streptomyces sp. NPDC051954]|uniref:GvpL/GvpF family gas vesicle protein n=1 Tax=Streptomyces sp. NPDC051954 TaxID=3155524 RepID=UPI00342AF8B7
MTELRYVYAICEPLGAELPAGLTGVAGDRPHMFPHLGLVAVVSHVPERDFAEQPLRAHLEDLDWLADTARAHERVIEALMGASITPLPLRLATVFHDDTGVRLMMEEQAAHFRDTLDRLQGRIEWGVKVYAEPEPEPDAEPAQGDGPRGKPSSGRDYLRQRRRTVMAREDTWQQAERFADRLHATLSAHAEGTRLHPPQNPALSSAPGQNVLNAAYLVPRPYAAEFMDVLDRTKCRERGVRIELTGPWAAYSFVESVGSGGSQSSPETGPGAGT